jgi:hypothetical protein
MPAPLQLAGRVQDVIYLLHALMALFVFIVLLNGFLDGTRKDWIDAAAVVFWLAAVAACFWESTYEGLFALGMSVVYGVLLRPFAARFAFTLRNR